ncbi:hypothetical protein BB558_000085 [Smittium angustum]|uniref:CSC1/OSCA1-like 7TM region domain-containing protein n=1 Tax=Smittium angustum TaxID=133377 RepID=A0A2U1JF61_SMIAN|nr:hypothetical protein BB558_000085 [Smittium angustum]
MSSGNDIIDNIFTDKAQQAQNQLAVGPLLLQAGIYAGLGLSVFILFSILRPNNGAIYARRIKEIKNSKNPYKSPKLSRSPFQWVRSIYRIPNPELLKNLGIDLYFYIRFLRLCTIQLAVMCFFGSVVLFPVNFKYGNNSGVNYNINQFQLTYLTQYHMTSLNYYWFHIVLAYLYSILFLLLIRKELAHYINVKQEYYASPEYQMKINTRSLMVTNIPNRLQNEANLYGYVMSISPSYPPSKVNLVRETGKLRDLIEMHEKFVRSVEKVLQTYLLKKLNNSNAERPKHKLKNGQYVDSIDHYTEQISKYESAIWDTKEKIKNFKPSSVGFISYDSPRTNNLSYSAIKKATKDVVFELAPEPNDIIWPNTLLSSRRRLARLWLSRLISVFLSFVAFIPISALMFVLDISTITSFIPKSKPFFDKNPLLTRIWQYVFLPLVLVTFYFLVIVVFRKISTFQGIKTRSGVERSVCKKMYAFYIITNIFVFTVVSAVLNMVKKNSSFGEILVNLPAQLINEINIKSQFWTSYVLLKALTSTFEITQPVSIIHIFSKRYFSNLMPRDVKDLVKAPEFNMAPAYSLYLWIFTICMLYCVYAPIILPFGLTCFLIAELVFRYNLLYVYKNTVETSGRMFKMVINRLILALLIFQFYFWYGVRYRLGQFQMKISMSNFIIPLPVATFISVVYFYFWSERNLKYPVGLDLSKNPNTNRENDEEYLEDIKFTFCNDTQSISSSKINAETTLGDLYLHPLLNKKLATPMVINKVQNSLKSVYKGRLDDPKMLQNYKNEPGSQNDFGILSDSNYYYEPSEYGYEMSRYKNDNGGYSPNTQPRSPAFGFPENSISPVSGTMPVMGTGYPDNDNNSQRLLSATVSQGVPNRAYHKNQGFDYDYDNRPESRSSDHSHYGTPYGDAGSFQNDGDNSSRNRSIGHVKSPDFDSERPRSPLNPNYNSYRNINNIVNNEIGIKINKEIRMNSEMQFQYDDNNHNDTVYSNGGQMNVGPGDSAGFGSQGYQNYGQNYSKTGSRQNSPIQNNNYQAKPQDGYLEHYERGGYDQNMNTQDQAYGYQNNYNNSYDYYTQENKNSPYGQNYVHSQHGNSDGNHNYERVVREFIPTRNNANVSNERTYGNGSNSSISKNPNVKGKLQRKK